MSKESPTDTVSKNTTSGTVYFEKQRDLLIQEISNSIDSVVYNLETLNRSLSESIQVGKEFDDVGKLWSHFYDGINKKKQTLAQKPNEAETQSETKSEAAATAKEDAKEAIGSGEQESSEKNN